MSWNPPPPPPRSTRRRPPRSHRGRVALLVVVLVAGALWMGWHLWNAASRPVVEKGTWLEVSFDASYPDERPEHRGLGSLFSAPPLSHQDLLRALRRAQDDPRIAGILLRPDVYTGGWAQAQELRHVLQELREGGKPVWAYLELSRSASYFLATAADSIAIAPEGNLLVLGLQARMSYYRRTLDKLGVRAEFVAIGEYKSAPESYTRDGPSDPARRQVEVFVDELWDRWLGELAQARGFSREHMADLVDQGYFDAEEAMDEGLVDRVLDERGLREMLARQQHLDADELPTIAPLDYLEASWKPSHAVDRKHRIALIHASGQIVPGSPRPGSGLLGSETLAERLRRAQEDDTVQAVVLRIDSPGGSTLASDTIWRRIEALREHKPVVVSMGNLAASGGYYIAMSADHIVAEPLSITGSIGVFVGKADLSGLYEKLGMSHELITRGENAGLFSELQPFTPDQREIIHRQLQRFYERFVDRVAEGRGLSFSQADSIARGRIWSGRDAKELGLVDELGGIDAAIQAARELAGIAADAHPAIVSYQRPISSFDRLMHRIMWDIGAVAFAPPAPWAGLNADAWRRLQAMTAAVDGSPQFLMPFQLQLD